MSEERAFFTSAQSKNDADTAVNPEVLFKQSTTNRLGAVVPRVVISSVTFVIFCIAAAFCRSWWLVLAGLLAGALVYSCIHIALEWERLVIVRWGKIHAVAGPGLILTMPIIESVASIIDLRMRSMAFTVEHVLTSDLVPVDMDAVIFWMVFDAKKASTEVQNYNRLAYWVSQTTLRDVIGSISITELSTRRTQIDKEVKDLLEKKTAEWGLTVISVEIRDIVIPEELQETLSIEAQAKQEYNARIILAEVEKEVSEMFVDAARTYNEENGAMQLRAMNFIYEGVKEKGGLVVVPSGITQAFDAVNGMLPNDGPNTAIDTLTKQ